MQVRIYCTWWMPPKRRCYVTRRGDGKMWFAFANSTVKALGKTSNPNLQRPNLQKFLCVANETYLWACILGQECCLFFDLINGSGCLDLTLFNLGSVLVCISSDDQPFFLFFLYSNMVFNSSSLFQWQKKVEEQFGWFFGIYCMIVFRQFLSYGCPWLQSSWKRTISFSSLTTPLFLNNYLIPFPYPSTWI
jgi:hypothetical protein